MPMVDLNLAFGWLWILIGLVVGMVLGLFFHREDWLGGYQSWRRRMTRLGHIAFLGTGILNILFGLTSRAVDLPAGNQHGLAAICFIIGAVGMPSTCFLSAWRKPLRHLFAIPVISLLLAVTLTVILVCNTS